MKPKLKIATAGETKVKRKGVGAPDLDLTQSVHRIKCCTYFHELFVWSDYEIYKTRTAHYIVVLTNSNRPGCDAIRWRIRKSLVKAVRIIKKRLEHITRDSRNVFCDANYVGIPLKPFGNLRNIHTQGVGQLSRSVHNSGNFGLLSRTIPHPAILSFLPAFRAASNFAIASFICGACTFT